MPNYRRAKVPGGTFFFTVVTHQRVPLFDCEDARTLLGKVIRQCQQRWPFEMDAIVLLPDHLLCLWSLPQGDFDFSIRWGWLKKEFTKRWLATGGKESNVSEARADERRRGIWQPRFWEHTIVDENDFDRHFDYIHYNPVKHGYVQCPHHWRHSSFHRWVKKGVYPWHWACWNEGKEMLAFDEIANSVGE